jgi:pyruvate ferredoxin oxidoreductase beta subunit
MSALQTVKFYQTGTFTVGNRLLAPEERSVQANMQRTNSLNSGHRACQGCGEALGARYAIDAAMNATNRQLIAANATGCLEVFSTPYPETSWQIPWIHSLFGNTAAVATGIAAAIKIKKQKGPRARTSAWSPRAATAAPPTSASAASRACSSATTTCSTSATTTAAT